MFAGLDPTTAIALVCGTGAALTFASLVFAFSGGSGGWRRYRRRLQSMHARAKGVVVTPVAAATRSLTRRESATPGLDRIVRQWLPRRELVAARLARTGRGISIGQYLIGVAGGSGVLTILIWLATAIWLTPIGLGPSFLVGLVITVGVSHWLIGYLGKRRLKAFIEKFPEAIDLMVRAVRAGLPISEAIVHAGHEMEDPVGTELRLVEAGLKLGRDLETLLWEIAKRIDVPEFRFFVIAFAVQRETGGNLAETLSNLSDVLRKRRQMREKIHAVAAESRATTCILGGLPVVVMGAFWCTAPDYLAPLFNDIRGLVLCGIAVVLLITGITVMSKMANIKI